MGVSGVIDSLAERSCVCGWVVETSVSDGDSGTPMERMKDGRTAEDASSSLLHFFLFSTHLGKSASNNINKVR